MDLRYAIRMLLKNPCADVGIAERGSEPDRIHSAAEGLLFQLPTVDPPVYAGVAIILSAVAAFAIFVPARRASRVDPIVALRFE